MTKYVLNSGGLRNNPKRANDFSNELIAGLGNKPKILLCLFAQPREYWEEKFKEYQNGVIKQPPKGVVPEYAWAYPDSFDRQVQWCDVLYLWGGDDHLLQYWLRQFDLPALWENKVVGGNSAGSNALVKHFWTCDWRQNMDGLGILPIKFITHYNSDWGADDPPGPIDWEAAYQELKEYGDMSLPVHALEEGDFVVIEQ
jgi:hypothetical protein